MRIAGALEGAQELASEQIKTHRQQVEEYKATEPERKAEEPRHNDLWERQIVNGEQRLAVEQLHNEMPLRGTAHT